MKTEIKLKRRNKWFLRKGHTKNKVSNMSLFVCIYFSENNTSKLSFGMDEMRKLLAF